jgi:tetratricopeptide (TPR) repeat protein
MGMLTLVCQQCGGQVSLDGSREFGYCSHCATKIIIQNDVINNTFNATYNTTQHITKNVYGIDGADAEELLAKANKFFEVGQLEKANEFYKKAMDVEPDNWRAWLGDARTSKAVVKHWRDALKAATTAIKFAPADALTFKESIEFCNWVIDEKNGVPVEILTLVADWKNDCKTHLEAAKGWYSAWKNQNWTDKQMCEHFKKAIKFANENDDLDGKKGCLNFIEICKGYPLYKPFLKIYGFYKKDLKKDIKQARKK